jgi:copper transport protein
VTARGRRSGVARIRAAAALGLVLGVALALGSAGSAAAHAELLLASPGPGTGLPQAPSRVVIHFTEPLNLALSRIDVLDASGRDATAGPTVAVPGDARAMQRPLAYLPVGRYEVRWITVSQIDGHTLRGSYGFAVGAAATAGETVADSPVDSEGWLGLAGRLIALLGLALWFGAALFGERARRAGLPGRRLRWLTSGAPAAVAVGGAMSLASSAVVATGGLSPAALGGVLASASGQLRLASAALGAAGTATALLPRGARLASAGLATVAILAEAGSGHAAGAPNVAVAIGSFGLHLASVGVWLFAIAASLLAGRRAVAALATFTPVAVAAAAITLATGVLNAYLSLGDPAQLVDTGYGLALLAKTAAFAAMVALGATHWWRRRRPHTGRSGMRLAARGEAGMAIAAIVLATLLVGFPNPPREVEAGGSQIGTDSVLATLGTRPAVSVAAASGPWVVGITVLPPEPGPVEVRVQVLGVAPGDGLRDARLDASLWTGGSPVTARLDPCGLGCFAGTASLGSTGNWTLAIAIGSNRGIISVRTTLPLPAPDGAAELARARAAMDGLSAAHLHETLAGSVGGPTVTAEYDFVAPDAMRLDVGGSERIVLGGREWIRSGAGADWTTSPWPGAGFSWPSGYLQAFWGEPVAARIVGEATVDGHPSRIVAFFRPDLPAWFRIWVGEDDGLVRREEMLAESHIMEHAYSELDGPIRIAPPS